ncbi:hypothetical protein ACF1G0_30535 [Streptomyces sp. NPDC013953]|uniref:hypothetical protein n=1 Tax=Streptomyces sp. NPDC013953 TaxID=3364868 RepID=UPI0036F53CAF
MRSVEWLAAAAADPVACRKQWRGDPGTALLEAGRYWNVLSTPEDRGWLALEALWCDRTTPPGPTLLDRKARRIGFFLPPDDDEWFGSGLRYARSRSWVAVPPPYREAGHLEWIIPPDGKGTLHSSDDLEAALRAAATTQVLWAAALSEK